MLHPYLKPLDDAFSFHANAEKARGAAAYMKHISAFYGIPSPLRKTLIKSFIEHYGKMLGVEVKGIVLSAWDHPYREMQYAAMEMLSKIKKDCQADWIELYEQLLTQKSWWDTIDFIAPHLVADYFIRFPEQKTPVINRWMRSENIWLQRSCIIFQLKAKQNTDEELLFDTIVQLSEHKEFFIRKAIGWALREYAKTQPQQVIRFVENHSMSNLSKREALKHFNR
jgi:3-methyladenine DNA glycosylase AlkD